MMKKQIIAILQIFAMLRIVNKRAGLEIGSTGGLKGLYLHNLCC